MVNYNTPPSDAKPAGADVLEDFVLVHAIHLLCPLEPLLSVTTFFKVVKYVDEGSFHWWQYGSRLLPTVVDHVETAPRQEYTGLFVLHKGEHPFMSPRHDIGIVAAQAQAAVAWNVAASEFSFDELEDVLPCKHKRTGEKKWLFIYVLTYGMAHLRVRKKIKTKQKNSTVKP